MSSAQASFLAKQGLSMLYNATVTSVSAISSGISMAYKSYADHYEKTQIETLRKNAKPPADVLYQVLIRFYYLSMAGYNNEVAAAAQKVAAKMTAAEKSSVTLESVGAVSHVLVSTCARYGDSSTGGWGLQDFLNSARMGKDHFDRDQLVNDLYFAILFAQDVAGGPGPEFEKIIRDAAGKMIEGEKFSSDGGPGFSSYTPSSALPSYAQVPAAMGSSGKPSASSSFGSAASSLSESDPKKRAAKVLNVVASTIKKAVDEAEGRRVRSLKEAEDMLRREKEKAAMAAGGPAPTSGGYSFGAAPTPAPAPAPSYGSSAKSATGFGSVSSFGAKPASGFGSAAPAAAPAAASSGWASFGSSGGSGASGGSSGFGGGSSSGFGTGYGSGSSGAGGFGSSTGGYSSLAPPPSGGSTGYGGSASTGGTNASGANFLGL